MLKVVYNIVAYQTTAKRSFHGNKLEWFILSLGKRFHWMKYPKKFLCKKTILMTTIVGT